MPFSNDQMIYWGQFGYKELLYVKGLKRGLKPNRTKTYAKYVF
jgi:hypothetical protein